MKTCATCKEEKPINGCRRVIGTLYYNDTLIGSITDFKFNPNQSKRNSVILKENELEENLKRLLDELKQNKNQDYKKL